MKHVFCLLLALALLLSSAALAEKPIVQSWNGKTNTAANTQASAYYPDDWTPNFDGTHSQADKWSGVVRTEPCEYEVASVGNTTIKVCPICGDFNGEKVKLVVSRYLKVSRLWNARSAWRAYNDATTNIVGRANVPDHVDAEGYREPDRVTEKGDVVAANGNVYSYLTNGQYMVRILQLPEDSDVAYAITFCHEIAGKGYDPECPYSLVLPVNGTGLTMRKAYFGTTRPFEGEVRMTNTGLYVKARYTSDCFGLFLLVR